MSPADRVLGMATGRTARNLVVGLAYLAAVGAAVPVAAVAYLNRTGC